MIQKKVYENEMPYKDPMVWSVLEGIEVTDGSHKEI